MNGCAKWQDDYRELLKVGQLMTATIATLYNPSADNPWMANALKEWSAVEGIERLLKHGAFEDFARLYALYPGW